VINVLVNSLLVGMVMNADLELNVNNFNS